MEGEGSGEVGDRRGTGRGMGTGPRAARMPRTPRFFYATASAAAAVSIGRTQDSKAATISAHHYKSSSVSSERSIPRVPTALCAVIITNHGLDSQICRWKRET